VSSAALIMMSATMAVQVIGIVRELFIAAQVGLSSELDALIIGIALPITLAMVLTAGIHPALVPSYMETREKDGRPSARRLAGVVVVWAALGGCALTVFMFAFADPLVYLMGPGLEAADRANAASYLRLMAPVAVALAPLSALFAVCQAERRFRLLAVATVVGPATALGLMLLLWSGLGLTAVAVGGLIGPFLTVASLSVAMWLTGIGVRPGMTARGLGTRAMLGHAMPLSLSSAILQLNPVVDRAIATLITPGGVSALRFGDSLLRAPISAINHAWGAAIYPALVAATRQDGPGGLGSSTVRTLRFTIVLFTPVALLAAAAAPVAVSVVYGRGAFGPEDVEAVARVLAAFSPMILIILADEVLTAALNARRKGVILLMAGTMNVILNFILDLVFGITLGVVGIAVSSTLTAALVVIWKSRRFRGLEGGVDLPFLARAVAAALAAAAPGAIVVGAWAWTTDLPPNALVGLLELAVFAVIGLGSYILIAPRMGLQEPRMVASYAVGYVRKKAPSR
jgi:putative peptidoglycan lipid II flippase